MLLVLAFVLSLLFMPLQVLRLVLWLARALMWCVVVYCGVVIGCVVCVDVDVDVSIMVVVRIGCDVDCVVFALLLPSIMELVLRVRVIVVLHVAFVLVFLML